MTISDQQAEQFAHGIIHANPTDNSATIIEKIVAGLMHRHQQPRANAYHVAINAVAEFRKPPGIAINTLKTNSSCVWLVLNGQEYAVPLDELMALINVQTEASACA